MMRRYARTRMKSARLPESSLTTGSTAEAAGRGAKCPRPKRRIGHGLSAGHIPKTLGLRCESFVLFELVFSRTPILLKAPIVAALAKSQGTII